MTKLITYAYMISETDISSSVENSRLDNPIKWAMDQLKFVLGRELYDEVYGQATTTPTTFSTNNAALFDPYIKQFLAWTAYHDYVRTANSYETRTGVRTFKEENSEPGNEEVVNMRVRKAMDKAQFYKGAMVNYIIERQNVSSSNFPLYNVDCNNQKFGTGFGISGVSRISTSQYDLTKRTIENGY